MTNLRTILAGFLALVSATAAVAQTFPTVPDHTVIGRLGTGSASGPAQAIPFATLSTRLGFFGLTGFSVGDILYANSLTTLAKLPAVAAGQPLISGGLVTAPAYAGDWVYFDPINKRLVLRKDTNTFPVPSSTSAFVLFGPDPGEGRADFGAIDSDAVLFLFRVNGTWASPTPVGDRQQICNITGSSTETNGGTTLGQGGYFGCYARGAWTASNHGFYWDVGVIPQGSAGAGLIKSARFSDVGGFAVNTADVFPALGTIDAGVGYTVNGAATSGNVLRADGTKFTSALLAATDVTNIGLTNYKATAVNFNSANTDTSITLTAPNGYSRYQILRAYLSHCSASATTATAGLFTAAAAGGTALVASGTAVTVSTASESTANNTQSFTIAVGASGSTTSITATPVFWRVQTPQGSAVTCDVTLQVQWIS